MGNAAGFNPPRPMDGIDVLSRRSDATAVFRAQRG
jgi:hypothetical protein